MILPSYLGKVTEIRFWKRARTEEEIKANLSTPLSIVNEKGARMILDIKEKKDIGGGNENDNQGGFNFDFGGVKSTIVPEADTKEYVAETIGGGWNFGDAPAVVEETNAGGWGFDIDQFNDNPSPIKDFSSDFGKVKIESSTEPKLSTINDTDLGVVKVETLNEPKLFIDSEKNKLEAKEELIEENKSISDNQNCNKSPTED